MRYFARTVVNSSILAEIMVPLLHNRIPKVCVLVAGTLILPALACAQENSPITAPQTQIDSLQTTVASLQNQVSSLQTSNTTLQSEVAALQHELTAARSVLAQVSGLQTSNTTLQSEVAALQHELTAARSVLAQVSSLQTSDTTLQSGGRRPATRIDGSAVRPCVGSLCQHRSKPRNRSDRAKYRL
jgi:chromosome segregation ATPase